MKAIRRVLDDKPVLDQTELELALWMRGRYFCTVFDAVKTILPAGVWYGFRECWSLAVEADDAQAAAAAIPGAAAVLELLHRQGGRAERRVLEETLGKQVEKTLKALKKAEILTCETDARQKISDKAHRMVALAMDAEDAFALTEPKRRSAPARYEVVCMLAAAGRSAVSEVCYFTGASPRVLKAMEKSGLVEFSQEEELRVPLPEEHPEMPEEIHLNPEQQTAFETILEQMPGKCAVGDTAARRNRQRKDAGIPPAGAGDAAAGQNGNGAGAGDCFNPADDAEIQLLLRQ